MTNSIRRYCLDANVLIQGWRNYYSPRFCPDYWTILKRLGHAGRIFLSSAVAEEITRAEDELTDWMKTSSISIYPAEESVQLCLRRIYEADPIHMHLVDNIKGRSLADPWVIAHAMDQRACVVTKEKKETATTKRIRIPTVCENMGIPCIDDFQLIEELGIRFSCSMAS